jgi:hypothetical protein
MVVIINRRFTVNEYKFQTDKEFRNQTELSLKRF